MSTTEVIWDSDGAATAASGASQLHAGPDTPWSPPLLLATAASTSLLNAFLALARDAQLPELGYVAQQRPHIDPVSGELDGITISASISVPDADTAIRARELWTLATESAPVLRVLKCPVWCDSSIVVLSECVVDPDGG